MGLGPGRRRPRNRLFLRVRDNQDVTDADEGIVHPGPHQKNLRVEKVGKRRNGMRRLGGKKIKNFIVIVIRLYAL